MVVVGFHASSSASSPISSSYVPPSIFRQIETTHNPLINDSLRHGYANTYTSTANQAYSNHNED